LIQYWCDLAVVGDPAHGNVAEGVLLTEDGGVLTSVAVGTAPAFDAVHLRGITIPGLVNAHSHAFHRALRGRTEGISGDFWSWRQQMYAVVDRLEPDTYYALARAVYAEMALAGITTVGEFHYLHHAPHGAHYDDANAMGNALVAAAADSGIRITLLDTCYLRGGFGRPLAATQLRFGDGSVEAWAERAESRTMGRHARAGAAIHSVRAVDRRGIEAVAEWAGRRQMPLHVHLSEQPAENAECIGAHGCTPTRLLAEAGVLTSRTTVVHATHLEAPDIASIGRSGALTCLCPTTERDLGDGVGPGLALAQAGSELCVGSDSHAVVDLFEEARGIELDQRLITRRRGHHAPSALLAAATSGGSRALGWPDAGAIAPGRLADLATVSLDTPRLAGTASPFAVAAVVFAATSADVTDVIVGGRRIVGGGHHCFIDDVGGDLRAALDPTAGDPR
jgi:formiminoglutamate deiminase